MNTRNKQFKVYVAGHLGMVGSAIVRELQSKSYHNILTRTRKELDLTNQAAVYKFFLQEKPDQVYLAAARVGGIHANSNYPAEFIFQNLMIQSNVIDAAFHAGVKKLLFLGSSCIYPRDTDQPMYESALLAGRLEPTNEPYAIAKIAGIKLCESYNRQYGSNYDIDYRSVMPSNLYGPGDNYHLENSHVIPALIRKFHEAKINNLSPVMIWGDGTPRREFLYVEDMARASVHIMNLSKALYSEHTEPMCSHINVGSGEDISIKELAELIQLVIGYEGEIKFDTTKPNGSPRKLMNSDRLNRLGWAPTISLKKGLAMTYKQFCQSIEKK